SRRKCLKESPGHAGASRLRWSPLRSRAAATPGALQQRRSEGSSTSTTEGVNWNKTSYARRPGRRPFPSHRRPGFFFTVARAVLSCSHRCARGPRRIVESGRRGLSMSAAQCVGNEPGYPFVEVNHKIRRVDGEMVLPTRTCKATSNPTYGAENDPANKPKKDERHPY